MYDSMTSYVNIKDVSVQYEDFAEVKLRSQIFEEHKLIVFQVDTRSLFPIQPDMYRNCGFVINHRHGKRHITSRKQQLLVATTPYS